VEEILTKNESGFSSRFNELLDMANFPKIHEGRYTEGAKRFELKSVATFRSWCVENKKPRTYEMLLDIVSSIMSDIPGDYDPHCVIAWLHGAKNPFDEYDIDSTLMLDVSLTVTDIAKEENRELSRMEIKNITMRIYKYLVGQRRKGLEIEPVEENRDAINLINFCLEQPND